MTKCGTRTYRLSLGKVILQERGVEVVEFRSCIAIQAQTMYIFPTADRPILRFFLKSINLKQLTISLNSHSTEALKGLIDLLNSSICGVRCRFRNGAWRCSLKGYAGSPYRHIGCITGPGVNANCCRSSRRCESCSIEASWRFPSYNKIEIIIKRNNHLGILYYSKVCLLLPSLTHLPTPTPSQNNRTKYCNCSWVNYSNNFEVYFPLF